MSVGTVIERAATEVTFTVNDARRLFDAVWVRSDAVVMVVVEPDSSYG